MNKNLASIVVFVFLMFGFSNFIVAQTKSDKLDLILFGDEHKYYDFKEISILVENLDQSATQSGLTVKQIQTDAEIRLQKAGLEINKEAEQFIYINVNTTDVDNYQLSYAVDVSLNQNAFLSRDKSLFTVAATWKKGLIGVVGKNNVREIRYKVSDFLDEFINNYLKYKNKNSNAESSTNSIIKKSTDSNKTSQENSPFEAIYVGGNRPPEVKISNDSDKTLYLEFGQGKMIAYTILSGTSKIVQIDNGFYNFKATAQSVIPLEGKHNFQKGYRYIWRFTIIKQ